MSKFTIHTFESAPEESKPLLEKSFESFGMLPNLHGVMAEAPGLLEGYQVLHDTTLFMVRNRGRLTDVEIVLFYAAGYDKRQLLEIVLGLSQKVMSNYVNHLAATPVDAPFQKFAWEQ